MAEAKISELVEKTTLHDTDLVPIVDIEATPDETKKITGANVKAQVLAGHKDLTTGVHWADADGIMTFPHQSSARAYLATDTSLTNGDKIPLDTKSWDIQNEFDTVNNRFVAKKAGIYLVTAFAGYTTGVVADRYYSLAISVNGAIIIEFALHSSHNQNIRPALACTTKLAINDYVELFLYNFPAQTITVQGGTTRTAMVVTKIA